MNSIRLILRKKVIRPELRTHQLPVTLNLIIKNQEDDYDYRILKGYTDYELDEVEIIGHVTNAAELHVLMNKMEKLFMMFPKDVESFEKRKEEFFNKVLR